MAGYIIRRILWGIVLLIIVCALTFVFFRVIPTGNPALLRAGRDPQPKHVKEIRRVLGLNKSLPAQFWEYMKDVILHFNFGYSYYSNESVRGLIVERLPATISLDRRCGRRCGSTAGLTRRESSPRSSAVTPLDRGVDGRRRCCSSRRPNSGSG